jgi:flagellar protein FlaG
MVSPIASGVAPAVSGVAPTAVQYPSVQPDPAVHVTGAASAKSAENSQQQQQPSDFARDPQQSVADALEKVNESLRSWRTGMRFEMDDEAQRLVVSIIDAESGEVIRKVPSEAVLKVARAIVQMQGGGVDTRV